MKRLLLDHFRRWWWIIVPLLLVDFGVILFLGGKARPTQSLLFTLPIFFGPLLLSFDQRHNAARALLALPLTARQLGRTWWLATVGLPAGAVLLVGALFDLLAGPVPGRTPAFLNACLQAAWLGASFFILTGTAFRAPVHWWERVLTMIFSLGWAVLLGGGVFLFRWFSWENPLHLGGFMAVGTVLTVAGWLRAETFVVRRAGGLSGHAAPTPGQRTFRAPSGSGGVPFLLRTLLLQMIRTAGLFVVVFVFIMAMNGRPWNSEAVLNGVESGVGNYAFMFIMFQLLPVVLHLRMLRSLPLSASTLASLLVFFPVGAILGCCCFFLAVKSAVVGGPIPGLSASTFIMIALCAMCIPLLVGRGAGTGSYLVIALPVMVIPFLGFLTLKLTVSAGWIGLVAAAVVIGAWALTRHLLRTGRETYRVSPQMQALWGGRQA